MSNDVIFSETTPFFYNPPSSISLGEEDEWLVYQVTHVEQSSDVTFHLLVTLLSTTRLLRLQRMFQQDRPLFKFIRGDTRLMLHALHQFLLYLTLLHQILQKILTSLLLFVKVHGLENPHILLLTLFPMIACLLHLDP